MSMASYTKHSFPAAIWQLVKLLQRDIKDDYDAVSSSAAGLS